MEKTNREQPGRGAWVLVLLFALVLGAWARLDQFPGLVLLDDEWHAVHQLLKGMEPGELLLTFGSSDYSIPLGLLYHWQARVFGLSELAMRWPMMVAGLVTLAGFGAWAWRRFPPRVAALFTFLLALSPLLVIYSRTARPYALTLLLGWAALWCFHRFEHARGPAPGRGLLWGLGYALCAALCAWLHPVTGPFLVAPFLVAGVRCLLARNGFGLARLLALAAVAGALMGALVLPPLLADPDALAGKAGAASFSLDTWIGVWYAWFGTPSTALVLVFGVLAAAGVPRLWRVDGPWTAAVLGLALVLAVVVLTEPRWAQHPLTLARYLLPALPFLLLAVACGLETVLRAVGRSHAALRGATALACVALLGAYAWFSPVRELQARPNAQANHILFQIDFRPDHNPIADYQDETLPRSPFWAQLPPGEGAVAAGPFHFETYNWAAPRWERAAGRRVLPLALADFCAGPRRGEAPLNDRFRFRNVVYPAALERAAPDWVVLTKPFTGYRDGKEGERVGGEVYGTCRGPLESLLGPPAYEDEALVAFRRSNSG